MYWSLIRCTISFKITPETLALFDMYAYPKLESKLITFLDHVFMRVPWLSFKYIHLYINELGFLLMLYQFVIIRSDIKAILPDAERNYSHGFAVSLTIMPMKSRSHGDYVISQAFQLKQNLRK